MIRQPRSPEDSLVDGLELECTARSADEIPYSKEALYALMTEYADMLDGFVSSLLRDDCDSVKVADKAWVELDNSWQRRGVLRDPENLLFRLARLRCIDRLRQLERRPEDLTDDLEARDRAAKSITTCLGFASTSMVKIDVRRAVAALPVQLRQPFVMVYGLMLPPDIAACLLGTTESKVNGRLRAAKRKLAESPHLAGYWTPAIRRRNLDDQQ